MRFVALVFLVGAIAIISAECNSEGDALYAWKTYLIDPNNVLQSWDPTLNNPCTWLHVTCNSQNSVVRVDLGAANLSGTLVPQLGMLNNLQYLQVQNNSISGEIPGQLGNLTKLVSLGLENNKLSGPIPSSLGNLKSLRWMRLNSNKLSGKIPISVLKLIYWGNLQLLNVSDNQLEGTVHHTNQTAAASPKSDNIKVFKKQSNNQNQNNQYFQMFKAVGNPTRIMKIDERHKWRTTILSGSSS